MRDITMPFDRETKSGRSFVAPFFVRGFFLQSVEGAVHLDSSEALRAKWKPFFLRRVAIETVTPTLVVPAAGADVLFAGHLASLRSSKTSIGARFPDWCDGLFCTDETPHCDVFIFDCSQRYSFELIGRRPRVGGRIRRQ